MLTFTAAGSTSTHTDDRFESPVRIKKSVLIHGEQAGHFTSPQRSFRTPGSRLSCLDNMNIWDCDGHGLYINSSDANGGSFFHGVMYTNGGATSGEDFTGPGYNIYDSSFLGNTYVSIQLGSGGQGSFYCDSVGGGSTFVGCYEEGTGGGENVVTGLVRF
jgi:hypothetical protein